MSCLRARTRRGGETAVAAAQQQHASRGSRSRAERKDRGKQREGEAERKWTNQRKKNRGRELEREAENRRRGGESPALSPPPPTLAAASHTSPATAIPDDCRLARSLPLLAATPATCASHRIEPPRRATCNTGRRCGRPPPLPVPCRTSASPLLLLLPSPAAISASQP